MKFDKSITRNSWINVEDWNHEDILSAARFFSGELGVPISGLRVYGPHKYLKKHKDSDVIQVLTGAYCYPEHEVKRIEETPMKKLRNLRFQTNNVAHRNLVINMLETLGYEPNRSELLRNKKLVNMHLDHLNVFANEKGNVVVGSDTMAFTRKKYTHEEIDVSWMDPELYKEKRETITIMGKTVYKDELEKAISDLTIIE